MERGLGRRVAGEGRQGMGAGEGGGGSAVQKASISNINEQILLGRPWSAGGDVDLKLIGVALGLSLFF